MSEDNNKFGDNLDNKHKTPSLGEDFEMWLKGRKEQKEFLEAKNHLDAQSQLADLKESLGKKPYEKFGETSKKALQKPEQDKKYPKLIALIEPIQTHQAGDEGKGFLQGMAQSVIVPLRGLKDSMIDMGRVILSPIKETQRTIAYLEQESPTKII